MRRNLACAALLLALLLPATLSGASAHWLDGHFGRGGVVRPSFVGNDRPAGVTVQPDGKIVVAATAFLTPTEWDFAVARFRPDGALDSSFGRGGKVLVDLGTQGADYASAVAVQPDGKIVIAGWSGRRDQVFESTLALIRLRPNGELDPTFGQGGKVLTDVGAAAVVNALALTPDRRLVVAGSRNNASRFDGSDLLVARYSSDGMLDPTFDGDGWQVTDLRDAAGESAGAVAVQRDGGIVVGGAGGSHGEPNVYLSDFVLSRYRPDGALDASFGDGGQVLVDLGPTDSVTDVSIQPNGRIVAAGTAGDWLASRPSRFALVRLMANGKPDRGFGRGGKVVTAFSRRAHDRGSALVRAPAGRLVVGGVHRVRQSSRGDFALARYRTDGTLDRTFGRRGLLVSDLDRDEEIVDLVRQRDGRIVALGSHHRGESNWGITLARYLSRPRR